MVTGYIRIGRAEIVIALAQGDRRALSFILMAHWWAIRSQWRWAWEIEVSWFLFLVIGSEHAYLHAFPGSHWFTFYSDVVKEGVIARVGMERLIPPDSVLIGRRYLQDADWEAEEVLHMVLYLLDSKTGGSGSGHCFCVVPRYEYSCKGWQGGSSWG